jgi:hypothetical protein
MPRLALAVLLLALLVNPRLGFAEAEEKSRADIVRDEADIAMDLAREGQYGRISRRDMVELNEAHAALHRLLEGHDDPEELDNEDRIALFNAQQKITAIVGNDDKNRKICKRVSVTGSRVAAVECMTVAQREARARASRSAAGEALRSFCVPGQRSGPGEQVSACSFQ